MIDSVPPQLEPTRKDVETRGPRALGDARSERAPMPAASALLELPQPLHLFEFLTGTGHYHYGLFSWNEELPQALERMAMAGVAHIEPGARVLDVGCGLGGTSDLLAQKGYDVLGIDPCPRSIGYARSRFRRSRANFLQTDFASFATEAFATEGGGRHFDALLFIEVLQHFPSLPDFFAFCDRLLDVGARIVVLDLAVVPVLPWSKVPCHRVGALAEMAGHRGYEVVERTNLTYDTLPTLPSFLQEMERRREEVVAYFQRHRPGVRRELAQLMRHMRAVHTGFRMGDLVFEFSVFEKTTDHRRL